MSPQPLAQSVQLNYNTQIASLVKNSHRIAQTFLDNHQLENLLHDYQDWKQKTNAKPYVFFCQTTKYDPFKSETQYYYNRFKRCTYSLIARQLDTHYSKYKAFQFIQHNYADDTTFEILENKLFDHDDFVNYDSFKQVFKEYEKHMSNTGSAPDNYTDLNTIEKLPSELSFTADDNSIHELEVENNQLTLSVKTPDCDNPDSHHDYSYTVLNTSIHPHLNELLEAGEACKPTVRLSQGNLYVDVPVKVETVEFETTDNKVLSCDLGVKTQVTSTVMQKSDDNNQDHLHQESTPEFYNHPDKQKLYRVIANRKQVRSNTRQHDNLTNKEVNLRDQIQHDTANYLVNKALVNKCEKLVLEDLSDLEAPPGLAETSEQISSWARGDLLDKIKYKASLVGLDVETVNPWGTSQFCPKCSCHGKRVNASNDLTENETGGWFYCEQCGFSADRDYIGALNVGRVFLSLTDRITECKPVEYISSGNQHAWFSSEAVEADERRSPSVQPATPQPAESHGFTSEAGDECCKKQNSMTRPALGLNIHAVMPTPIQYVLNHTM